MGISMAFFKKPTEAEVQEINHRQRDFFGKLIDVFDPPLPEGVPERLDRIVAAGRISDGEVVLDVGTGTGILVPLIQRYDPETIFACDLSGAMLAHLKEQYPYAKTLAGDIRDVRLPDQSVDVVFLNACYPNIIDKAGSFQNIFRMMKPGGRMVLSHPMGKSFIDALKEKSPFPLDQFPSRFEAEEALQRSFGFLVDEFIDEPELYILVVVKPKA